MTQPEGYVLFGREEIVCKLKKSIHGLKLAVIAWNDQLDQVLKMLAFHKTQADSCLYVKESIVKLIYLITYVDDFITAAKEDDDIQRVANSLKKTFSIIGSEISLLLSGNKGEKRRRNLFYLTNTIYQ